MILSILVAISFTLYVYLAVASLTMMKPLSLSHWLLFAASCLAAYWTFFSFFVYNADSLEQLKFWFNISTLGMFLFFPTNLLFMISVVPYRKLTMPVSIFIMIPGLILFILNFFYPVSFSEFIPSPRGWIFIPAGGNPLNIFWMAYASAAFLAGIIMMIEWRRKTKLNRERKQIRLLIITQIIAEVLVLLEYRLHDLLIGIRLASISPVLISIWVLGMVIAVKRYNFLSISPETVSREILNSLSEPVILLSDEKRVLYLNKKALSLFNKSYLSIEKTRLRSLSNLTASEDPLASMQAKTIEDRYGDPLGYLFIGSNAKKTHNWGLTKRENDIIELLGKIKTNRQIAEELKISEQTVKNHMVSILHKTGAKNRIELLNLLKR